MLLMLYVAFIVSECILVVVNFDGCWVVVVLIVLESMT